jgi:4-amino-4-deoxy-L-arabinose transferase-like glycosyltransferase
MKEKIIKILEKINERLGRFFDRLETKRKTTIFFLFLISFLVRLTAVNWSSLLQKDAFVYLLQALDMVHGNFIPSASQSVGLSLWATPFFLIFGNDSIFHNMTVARVVSCLFGAAVIFPLYILAKELCEKRARTLVLIMFAFLSTLVLNAAEFLTEPLFSFFFLFSLYFSVRYIKKKSILSLNQTPPSLPLSRGGTEKPTPAFGHPSGEGNIYLSFLFAGLAYYVRPNGFFLLAILLSTYLIVGWKNLRKMILPSLIGIIIFFAVAAPFLIQRDLAFGSPFTYGENDKYWVEDYSQVWANNIPVPSLGDYLRGHDAKQIFDRFVFEGAVRVAFDLFRPKDLPLLAFFLLLGFGLNIFKKEFWPLYISLAVFFAGLSLVYFVFNTSRHVFPLFPILLIFMAAGVYEVLKNHKYKELLLGLFIVCFIMLSATALYKAATPATTMPTWAVWAAENVRGRIGVVEGGDFIIMNLPDATTAGVNQKDLYAPKSGLSVTRPGVFKDLPEAMKYFKKTGMTDIIYDDHVGGRAYLREMLRPEYQGWFKEIYSNASSSDSWKVKIYEIEWDKYKQVF